jgi:hypothetical protein
MDDGGAERWNVGEKESKTFDFDGVERLKVSVIKGRIDVIGHDDPTCRLEVSNVRGLPVEVVFDGHTLKVRNPSHGGAQFSLFGVSIFGGFGKGLLDTNADVSLLVPRDVAAKISTVKGDALVSGLSMGAKMDTVSGSLLSDGVSGMLKLDTVSGKVEARNHHGSVKADTVSGDVIVSGNCEEIRTDAVGGNLYVDAFGAPRLIRYEAVGGNAAIRLDPEVHAVYKASAVGGKAIISGQRFRIRDGFDYSDGPANGRTTEIRFETVGGNLKVVRRALAPFAMDDDGPDADADRDAGRSRYDHGDAGRSDADQGDADAGTSQDGLGADRSDGSETGRRE